MRVRLESALLNDPAYFDRLDRIVEFFFNEQHLWDLTDLGLVGNSAWIQSDTNGRAGRRNLAAFQKCVTAQAYPPPSRIAHATQVIIVGTRPAKTNEIHVTNAEAALRQPAVLLVENSGSDGGFVETLIASLRRSFLASAKVKGLWKFEHAGGIGEFPKRYQEIVRGLVGPIRIFILSDSDAEYPGHIPPQVQQLRDFCNGSNVPLTILSKRSIENYIPPPVLIQVFGGEKRKRAVAFKRQGIPQRDHYDMKSGFSKDATGSVIVSAAQQTLYADLSTARRKRMCGGFGANVADVFVANRNLFNESLLRSNSTDNGAELDAMLDKLESLI